MSDLTPERIEEQARQWRAWATGERKNPPHNLLAFTSDVLATAAALREAEAENERLREGIAAVSVSLDGWAGDELRALLAPADEAKP